jgi:hypothetical protein
VINVHGLRSLTFLHGAARPHIAAFRVGSRGEAPTTPTAVPLPQSDRAARGWLTLRVRGLRMHDALLVRLSAPLARGGRQP